ncbi:odorant receptor 42b-like [Drosophila grimshawi]|uniref:odorant receptor 42b-like n=1 Tax=Drosophila grimshawi TaxID=7222 RepID=UPI0013EF5930|nr:odorant receptor 42b-like [Drosophila grimshawi]
MIFNYVREPTLGNLMPYRDAFKYLERGMKCVGWILPERGFRYYWLYLCWMALVLTVTNIYLPIVSTLGYVIYFEPSAFLSKLQSYFNLITLYYKTAVILTNMWRFQKVKELFDLMDKRCVTNVERIEVHRCVARCNWVYLINLFLYTAFAILSYLSAVHRGFTPWGFYMPFVDYRESTRNLWIAATFEYFVGSCAVYADLMIDTYPLMFGLILRSQLQLLIKRVHKLRTIPDKTDNENYDDLVKCIKDHKLVLQYCDLFRPIISRTFFARLLVIGLGLGLSMINLMFFTTFWTGLPTFIFIVILVIQSSPFCYVCELIKDECYNLTLAIFYTNYVDAGRRYNSTLIYFLYQSQQAINFTAGGIFPISMQTNISFTRFAFTVVTIFKEMGIIEKLGVK